MRTGVGTEFAKISQGIPLQLCKDLFRKSPLAMLTCEIALLVILRA